MGRPSRHLGNLHRPALLGDAKPQATERQHPCPCDIPIIQGILPSVGCSWMQPPPPPHCGNMGERQNPPLADAPLADAPCAVQFPNRRVLPSCLANLWSDPEATSRGPSSTFPSIDCLPDTPGSEGRSRLASSACPVFGKEGTTQLAYYRWQDRGRPACREVIGKAQLSQRGTGATSSLASLRFLQR